MSEWCQIENGYLTIQLTTKGAEMKRLYHRVWNRELLWSGENKIWERSSPILFPIVGKLKNDEYTFQGKKYTLAQHGFARDMEFTCTQASVHECEFRLVANSETFLQYPFLFELNVHYAIEGTSLSITYSVKNTDRQDIYFSIGAHPGFETTKIEDFEIQFEKSEGAYFITRDGLIDPSTQAVLTDSKLALDAPLLSSGALIFKTPNSSYIDLIHKVKNQVIRLSGIDVPYLGIWGKEHLPFVCLEPWHGIADFINHDQNLENKEGIIKLAEGRGFSFTYTIEMIQR